MKKLILFIAVLLVHGYSYAQDPHFSQFFASPLTINPANTGNFSGSLRAALNSRTQLFNSLCAEDTKTHLVNLFFFSNQEPPLRHPEIYEWTVTGRFFLLT